MKVLWIASFYPFDTVDLNGSFFREQAAALVDAGVDLRVVAASPVYANTWWRRPLLRRNHYHQPTPGGREFPVWFRELRMWPPGWRFLERAPLHRFARTVWKELEHSGWIPDVIHVQTAFPGLLVAMRVADWAASRRKLKLPVILTEHRPATLDNPQIGRRGEELARGVAQAVLCTAVSSLFATELQIFFKRQIAALGDKTLVAPKWETTPNLLGPVFENNAPEWMAPHETEETRSGNNGDSATNIADSATAANAATKPFLHVSNLGPMKNVESLLRGYARSGLSRPLRIVGPESRHPELQALAAALKISARVSFTPTLSRAEVRQADAQAAAFLLSSTRETFGIVLIEALSQGIPVLSTPTWGALEILGGLEGDKRGELTDRQGDFYISEGLRKLEERLVAGDFDPQKLRQETIETWGFRAFTEGWKARYAQVIQEARDAGTEKSADAADTKEAS